MERLLTIQKKLGNLSKLHNDRRYFGVFGLLYFCEVCQMLSRTPETSAQPLLLFFSCPLLEFISWYDKKLRLEIYTYLESSFRRNEDMDWIEN